MKIIMLHYFKKGGARIKWLIPAKDQEAANHDLSALVDWPILKDLCLMLHVWVGDV